MSESTRTRVIAFVSIILGISLGILIMQLIDIYEQAGGFPASELTSLIAPGAIALGMAIYLGNLFYDYRRQNG